MPSFDVVSEIDKHELSNAVDQANREIETRFDFKGSDAKVEQNETELVLDGQNEFQLRQMLDILEKKLTKRGLDIGFLEEGKLQENNNRARIPLAIREGIDKDLGKKIVKLIKESKIKVQASIQGDQVRVTGKKRDDLQQVIALLKESNIEQPLQFNNFRD